jgi:hypothetical protein
MKKENPRESLGYEWRPGDSETLGDDGGVLADIPREALRESERARHTFLKDKKGKVVSGKKSGAPGDPYGEERISEEPRIQPAPLEKKAS